MNDPTSTTRSLSDEIPAMNGSFVSTSSHIAEPFVVNTMRNVVQCSSGTQECDSEEFFDDDSEDELFTNNNVLYPFIKILVDLLFNYSGYSGRPEYQIRLCVCGFCLTHKLVFLCNRSSMPEHVARVNARMASS